MIEQRRVLWQPGPKITIAVLAVGALLVVAGFFAWQSFVKPKDQIAENQSTLQRVKAQAGAIFMLPEGDPVLIQIQDKQKLSGQPFYEKAENGDYVLVYEKAKYAIIFREKTRQVINANTISIGEESAPPQN
ncbi:MAG TPA: hypothetical protein VFO38_04135 [Candidatus Saccharimonadales bacterium]|nr:hypothetical protein [Candidatus Saccharimonadales bacterium]